MDPKNKIKAVDLGVSTNLQDPYLQQPSTVSKVVDGKISSSKKELSNEELCRDNG